MIADVARTLAGEEGDIWLLKRRPASGKPSPILFPVSPLPGRAKTLVVSTANVALQDQIFSKDLPLLRKIIPDLRFTAAFGRGRYVSAKPGGARQ